MLLDTPICDFGWQAPPFQLEDPHGVTYEMADLMGPNGLLIAFICNHCPYVHAVIDRLVADASTLQGIGINTVAIMPNDYANYPADSPDKMIQFAAEHRFGFPYLIDHDQAVAQSYGAICTPDFFGLNAKGELQYRGRIDDAKMGDASNRSAELLEAMRLVAATGSGPREQSPSMGCSIKWR